jgi:hypothetical protein
MNAGDAITETLGRAPGFADTLAWPGSLRRLNRLNLGYNA